MIALLIRPFSALASWQGYEYQAHIAIYVVLKKIEETVTSKMPIENLLLEIEGAEDFSIKNEDEYISLHQVKSSSISLGTNDKFAFIISLLQYNAQNGFYHIAPGESIANDFVEKTVESIDELLIKLDLEIKKASEVKKSEYDNYIIFDKILSNSKKGSLYNILDYICHGDKSEENIKKSILLFKEELNRYRDLLTFDGVCVDDSSLFKVWDETFENINKVKEKCFEIIKNILNLSKPEWETLIDEKYISFLYDQTFLFIKNKINDDYVGITDDIKKSIIKITEIFDNLLVDYHKNANSIQYQYHLLWETIQKVFDDFPTENNELCGYESCEKCEIYDECNLAQQYKHINSIDIDEINDFLYKLILKTPQKGKPNELPTSNLIKRLFAKSLKNISLLKHENNNIIQAQKNGEFFRLTLDSSGEIEELQKQICDEVQSAEGDKLLIYESDVLITDNLNVDNLIYDGIKATVMGEQEYRELENITTNSIEKIKINCNKPKVLRLIDRKNAVKELNE